MNALYVYFSKGLRRSFCEKQEAAALAVVPPFEIYCCCLFSLLSFFKQYVQNEKLKLSWYGFSHSTQIMNEVLWLNAVNFQLIKTEDIQLRE